MEKIEKLLENLQYEDLMQLHLDISHGGMLLKNIVSKKLAEAEHNHTRICACCGKGLQKEIDDIYTLLFGEQTIKKKASFCGSDCLQEFITDLAHIKQQSYQQEIKKEV